MVLEETTRMDRIVAVRHPVFCFCRRRWREVQGRRAWLGGDGSSSAGQCSLSQSRGACPKQTQDSVFCLHLGQTLACHVCSYLRAPPLNWTYARTTEQKSTSFSIFHGQDKQKVWPDPIRKMAWLFGSTGRLNRCC
jgi:hypothetical protein